MSADPASKALRIQLEKQAYDFFVKQQSQGHREGPGQILTIPVVVHIIHDNGPENIADAQVQQAIAWLNEAFANTGFYDQGSGTDVGIQFCLAQRTPAGAVTNGITRDQNFLTSMTEETQDLAVKDLNRWDPQKYLNIWLVREICSTSAGCGVVGYAYRPEYHGTPYDGLMIEAQFFGAVQSQMSVAVHEIGHYLGLYHTFEGGCTNNNCLSDGDRICDTPPDQSTASIACGQSVNTCSTDVLSGFTTDQPDMTSNFLDYGNINCFHDFTPGQAARMVFYLDGIRHSLLSSKACLPPCTAPATSAFTPSATNLTPGQTVMFTNNSQNAAAYEWTVNGVAFSTLANPSYTFTQPGTYTINLLAQPGNPATCEPASSQAIIQVACTVVAGFTLSNANPQAYEVVTVTNTSQNASSFLWTVNGVAQGSLPTVAFSSAGVYTITLEASNAVCQSSSTQQIFVQDSCTGHTFQLVYTIQSGTGYSTTALADGSILLVGSKGPDMYYSNFEFFVAKLTPDGVQQWVKTFDEDIFHGYCNNVVATSDSGFILSLNEIVTGKCHVAKLKTDGSLEWMQTPDLNINSGGILDIKVNAQQEILVMGQVGNVAQEGSFFAKYDPIGNLIWSKYVSPFTGIGDYWERIAALPDGGLIAVGNQGNGLAQVARLDANGGLVWRKRLFLTGAGGKFYDLVIHGGGIYINGLAPTYNPWLLKLDLDGQMQWSKAYSNTEVVPTTHRMIWAFDGLTLCGSGPNNPTLMRFDSTGNLLWKRNYSALTFKSLVAVPGGYFVAGISYNYNPCLVKINASGFSGSCPFASEFFQTADKAISVIDQVFLEKPPFTSAGTSFPVVNLPLNPAIFCEKTCSGNGEICNNNLDDDGDGLFDCLDPECPCVVDECQNKRNNRWYFGILEGLDFSTEPPTKLTDGKTKGAEVSATISDDQGNLLFYTDGRHIFNRFHQIMPNGTNTTAIPSAWEGNCIIVPHPGDPALYYVFIMGKFQPFSYSLVDMRLDNGRGDVVPNEHFVYLGSPTQQIQGLTATRSCNFDGYWLAVNRMTTRELLAYRIDLTGFHIVPIISSNGDDIALETKQMKFSPNGKQLARVTGGDSFMLYDFDIFFSQAGQFTNFKKVKIASVVPDFRGLEYAPGGRFLYVSGSDGDNIHFQSFNVLYQFDLEAGSLAAITNSKIKIASEANSNLHALQLAPNGKIYSIHNSPDFKQIDIIHAPDKQGLACQFQESGIVFPNIPAKLILGFSNCITSDFLQPHIAFDADARDSVCTVPMQPVSYTLKNVHCDVDSIQWILNGLAGNITANYQYASVVYPSSGQGQLIVKAYTACGLASDTLNVTVNAPTTNILNLGPDRTVCDNGVFTFNAGSGFAQYRWQNGSPDSVLTTILPGKYWVDVFDQCGNRQTDTVVVKVASTSVLSLGPDVMQCAGLPVTFQRPAWFSQWAWSPATGLDCDTCATITAQSATTTSWTALAQTADGCLSLDTLHWFIADTLRYTHDTTVCSGQSVDFYGIALPPDTTAIFHFTGVAPGCDTLVTVHVFGLQPYMNTLMERICPEDSLPIYGTVLRPDTTAVFYLHGIGCDSIITVEVQSFLPVVISLPADTSILIGDHLTLPAAVSGSGGLIYSWQPGSDLNCTDCLQPVAGPLSTITYALQVTDGNGCVAGDSIVLRVNPDCRLLIPNAFTPNGDGVNDWFYPSGDPCLRTVRLWQIRNRWGQMVFERRNFAANQQDLGWDGRFRGKDAPSDVLVWVAEFEYYDGRVEQKKGEVVLLR